jgi:hypothetical protein
MNKELEMILKQAKKTNEINKIIHSQRLEQEKLDKETKEKEVESKRENKVTTINYETDCYSEELLGLIKQYKFEIESYEKFTDIDYDDYCPTLEIYYCNFNNWNFEIKNFSDVDIEEGIFAIGKVKHVVTGEELEFYCDLGCRNTGKEKLNHFLDFITYNSLQDYVNEKYEKYVLLPKLLKEQGYNIEEVNYSFKLNEPQGYLKLADKLFVKVYRAWMDDFKLVVTNDYKWDVNSANDSVNNVWNKKAYFFNYNSINDIEELCKCIDAFKDDMKGKIGYQERDLYYGNDDIIRLFNEFETSNNKEERNTYLIQIKHKNYWDRRGYDEDNSVITNKYKGLEIYTETELTFNDASQWSKGNLINKSIITFKYDKREDSNKCKLIIDNYIYETEDDILDFDYDEEEYKYKPAKNKVEISGTFTELYEILEEYIRNMFKIHDIAI